MRVLKSMGMWLNVKIDIPVPGVPVSTPPVAFPPIFCARCPYIRPTWHGEVEEVGYTGGKIHFINGHTIVPMMA